MDVIVVQMLLNRLVRYGDAHLVISQLDDVIVKNKAFFDKFHLEKKKEFSSKKIVRMNEECETRKSYEFFVVANYSEEFEAQFSL